MPTEAQAIAALLNKLRSGLGTRENPPGSNWNLIVAWYNANVDRIGAGPWCEMTNTWGMWTSGAKDLKRGRAYTVYAAKDAIDGVNGSRWFYGTSGMRAGDQVYYDWSGRKGNYIYVDHTGTVEKVNGDGTFYALEGNVNDKFVRIRRDSKYVVGYVRFDWSRIAVGGPLPPKPDISKPKPTYQPVVKALQALLKVEQDGQWGETTDAKAELIRIAALNKTGAIFPIPSGIRFDVRETQRISGTTPDGVWGPKSQSALVSLVKKIQALIGVTADGVWGPKTESAYQFVRKGNKTSR